MKKTLRLLANITALGTVALMTYNCYDIISRSAYDSAGLLNLALSGLVVSAILMNFSEGE